MSKIDLHECMMVDGAKLLRLLGSGKSGEVWYALAENNAVVALKIYTGKDEVKDRAYHEYSMADRFKHDNILAPLGISSFESHPVIRLPYCEGRSVDGMAAYFSERMIWKLIEEVSGALAEIHSKGYAHFDIKPSNILWNGQKFMLSDFGACMSLGDVSSGKGTADASSYRFDAPEFNTRCCAASDVWSLGATIFYLYMGCHVFNGLGGKAQHPGSPVPFMRKSQSKLSLLVQNCLDFDHCKRPTSKVINEIAQNELMRLKCLSPKRNLRHDADRNIGLVNAEFWPDQMIDNNI